MVVAKEDDGVVSVTSIPVTATAGAAEVGVAEAVTKNKSELKKRMTQIALSAQSVCVRCVRVRLPSRERNCAP